MKKNILSIVILSLVSLYGISFCGASVSTSIQNNVTRYIDTEGNIFSGIGTITIMSGNQSIIMLDRNLGATERGVGCTDVYEQGICSGGNSTYGYHFQWGNNYGFTHIPYYYTPAFFAVETNLKPDTSGYGWDNPYVSGTYIEAYVDWSAYSNNSLWGGMGDTTGSQTNPDYMRQGPCPEGFHVPSVGEFQKLVNWTGPTGSNYNNFYFMPYAGERYNKVAIHGGLGRDGVYWTSSPSFYFRMHRYYADSGELYDNINDFSWQTDRSYGHSIRCFKDNYAQNQIQLVLSYDTVGGQAMQGQTVLSGNKAHVPGYDPKKEGYIFSGWYKDPQYTQKFLFLGESAGLTQNTTIYAKWIDPNELTGTNDTGTNTTGSDLTGNIEVGISSLGLIIGTPNSVDLGSMPTNTTKTFTFTEPFWIKDLRGASRGHYTTIQLNGLYQVGGNGVITGVRLVAASGAVLSGGIANGTQINPSMMSNNGVDITNPVLFFYRENGQNSSGVVNQYISMPLLKINTRGTPAGTYRGSIVYTLYDIGYED